MESPEVIFCSILEHSGSGKGGAFAGGQHIVKLVAGQYGVPK